MSESKYKSVAESTDKMPGGIPYIIGNEAAERFSFYGMKGILVIFMTQFMMGPDGELATLSETKATEYYHLFTMVVYFMPIFGALLSDIFLGKYKTILLISIVYCIGHFVLAFEPTGFGMVVGLSLIAVGAGGIKPCVSAHVGDQFGQKNKHLLPSVFLIFYFAINLGSFFAYVFMEPILRHKGLGPEYAFGIPGVLMLIATIVFWMGRNKFVHIPPGGKEFIQKTFTKPNMKTLGKLCIIYLCVAPLWSLFDQTGSSMVLQAGKMDLNFMGIEWLASQIQLVNPALVMILIPIFSFIIYPMIDKVFPLTPLRKISLGMYVMILGFLVLVVVEKQLVAGETPNIAWHFLAYIFITAAEVMVSITCLEFAYSQAPNSLKSTVLSFYLLSMSLGNFFTYIVNVFIQNPDGTNKLSEVGYFWFFSGFMLVSAIIFSVVAYYYQPHEYIQGDEEAA